MCAKVVKRQPKSAEQALASLMRECAKSERSTGDAMRLMARWEVAESEQEGVVERLQELKFIDNRRYAEAFVRDKLNFNGWGKQRIKLELSRKGVEREIIEERLAEVDVDNMRDRLRQMIEKRSRTTKHKDIYDLKGKLLRYGATLGYDYTMVREVIEEVLDKDLEECTDIFF